MEDIIAFHSYKGGTGKTTIAANCAALLATKGYRVCLLDLDVYAPSLQSYFKIKPENWLNDFLYSNTDIQNIMIDFTQVTRQKTNTFANGGNTMSGPFKTLSEESIQGKNSSNIREGRLWIGFCNNRKEDIQRLESGTNETKREIFRKLVFLREKLISNYSLDYLIVDTSPGIRYWSLSVLAIADIFLLTLKMGDLDIEGTKVMANEIYSNFTKGGSRSFLVCNRVAGYCIPYNLRGNDKTASTSLNYSSLLNNSQTTLVKEIQKEDHLDSINTLSEELNMEVISTIPCYCDIQFAKKEFLTVIKHPDHPFTKQLDHLINSIQTLN
jgi:chromosome partitioning protein